MFKNLMVVVILLLAVILTNNLVTGVIFAEENKEEETKFDAHASFTKLHFDDSEMDFAFALILGATMNHGCEIGEAFYTATNIKEGSAASWQEEWINMAERAEARAEQSLAGVHEESAREQLQRAAYYYRTALVSMMPDDPRFK